MYLEDKLDQLVLTVDRLIVVIEQLAQQTPPAAQDATPPKDVPAPDAVPESVAEPSVIDKDGLQAYCLEQVRKDKKFKDRLMGELGKYQAKTISQLPDNAVSKVYAALGGAA